MDLTESIVLSIAHCLTFFLYNRNYARLRKSRAYGSQKTPIPRMSLERKMTKVAFVIGSLSVLASFWLPSGTPGFYEVPFAIRSLGVALSFVAFCTLKASLNRLGENYSPLFDTHRPHFIVQEGAYKIIRHPVYLSNMCLVLGYVISSASVFVLFTSAWSWGYMIASILREEKYLAEEFPEYRDYQKKSWRIIPYLF